MENPFELFSYRGPKYFCDRENELKDLVDAFESRRNLVLISDRRLGKTQLIKHFQYHLKQRKDIITIYVDILNTTSDEEFINKLITESIKSLEDEERFGRKFLDYFQGLRPSISMDPLTGTPSFSMNISKQSEVKASLDGIMGTLISDKRKIQIAIDEFQQISNYERGTVVDATLRSYFPEADNINFLFSGSETHTLLNLFNTAAKPLFASTGQLAIDKIGYAPYFDFIKCHFEEAEIEISDRHIHNILQWTEIYTFYTHFLCNMLFQSVSKKVTDNDLMQAKLKCLRFFEHAYYSIKKTLPTNQWKTLIAIAKEGDVTNITGKDFTSKYRFSSSTTAQAVAALQKKQLVKEDMASSESIYSAYDIFFKRWAEQL